MPETSLESRAAEQRKKLQVRVIDEDLHPCLKEAEISRKCLEKHSYDNVKCVQEFENYNTCKRFWPKKSAKKKPTLLKVE